MAKSLSIIVPTLNEAGVIADTLASLQPLRRGAIELIVADGGSTDGTIELAQPMVDRLWRSDPGRARQMNAGAMVASGHYLLFVHADTLLPADFQPLWRHIRDCRPQWGFFRLRLSGAHPLLRMVEFFINWRSRLTAVGTGDQCLYVRRELFEQLGGFADIPLMEDVEISKRLRRHSRPHRVGQPVVTSSRRWEQQGIWRTVWLMWRLRLAYCCGVKPERLARRYYSSR